jgi:uncharacterized protein YjbI with pentapeptide repeats
MIRSASLRFALAASTGALFALPAAASCTFGGSPATFVNCINEQVNALNETVETLRADHDLLVLENAALQESLTDYATLGDIESCLTADDLTLTFMAEQGLQSRVYYDLDVRYGNFERADLSKADLRGDFSYSMFRRADLTGATFYGGTAIGAVFHNADLTGASLSYADLTDADFTNANLTDVEASGSPIMAGATWSNTICRDGTNSDDNGGTCCGHMYWAGVACD